MQQYLQPTAFIDFDSTEVASYAEEKAGSTDDPKKQAVNLYYAVRDGIFYDPYAINLSLEGLRASSTLEIGRGWCVTKAVCCLQPDAGTWALPRAWALQTSKTTFQPVS